MGNSWLHVHSDRLQSLRKHAAGLRRLSTRFQVTAMTLTVVLFKIKPKLQRVALCLHISLLPPIKHGDTVQKARASRRLPGQAHMHTARGALLQGLSCHGADRKPDLLRLTAPSRIFLRGVTGTCCL